jgi:hypothetical protein
MMTDGLGYSPRHSARVREIHGEIAMGSGDVVCATPEKT